MDINLIWHYIQQNWFQLFIDVGFGLNVIAAGTRVMGWSKISTELGKVEDALTAMVQAMISRKNPVQPTITETKP